MFAAGLYTVICFSLSHLPQFLSYLRGESLGETTITSSYNILTREVLEDNARHVPKLALVHSFLRMSSDELWIPSLHETGALPALVLELYFVQNPHLHTINTLEVSTLLFLSKIGQLLSSRCK